MPCEEGTSSAVMQETTDGPMDPENDVSIHERGLKDTPVLPGERDYLQQELELYRKERERQLLRRERKMTHSASTTSSIASTIDSVWNIKDLLPEFDTTDNTFWRWKNQLELLRNAYRLDDNTTKILISSRLKGRALIWFYSKAEYLTLSIENLLEEMQQMFDLHSGLSLRKEFEARVWKTEKQFCDYYHEKMILANRVSIAEDELLDYLRRYYRYALTKPGTYHELRVSDFSRLSRKLTSNLGNTMIPREKTVRNHRVWSQSCHLPKES